jgi:PKD repeat protein
MVAVLGIVIIATVVSVGVFRALTQDDKVSGSKAHERSADAASKAGVAAAQAWISYNAEDAIAVFNAWIQERATNGNSKPQAKQINTESILDTESDRGQDFKIFLTDFDWSDGMSVKLQVIGYGQDGSQKVTNVIYDIDGMGGVNVPSSSSSTPASSSSGIIWDNNVTAPVDLEDALFIGADLSHKDAAVTITNGSLYLGEPGNFTNGSALNVAGDFVLGTGAFNSDAPVTVGGDAYFAGTWTGGNATATLSVGGNFRMDSHLLNTAGMNITGDAMFLGRIERSTGQNTGNSTAISVGGNLYVKERIGDADDGIQLTVGGDFRGDGSPGMRGHDNSSMGRLTVGRDSYMPGGIWGVGQGTMTLGTAGTTTRHYLGNLNLDGNGSQPAIVYRANASVMWPAEGVPPITIADSVKSLVEQVTAGKKPDPFSLVADSLVNWKKTWAQWQSLAGSCGSNSEFRGSTSNCLYEWANSHPDTAQKYLKGGQGGFLVISLTGTSLNGNQSDEALKYKFIFDNYHSGSVNAGDFPATAPGSAVMVKVTGTTFGMPPGNFYGIIYADHGGDVRLLTTTGNHIYGALVAVNGTSFGFQGQPISITFDSTPINKIGGSGFLKDKNGLPINPVIPPSSSSSSPSSSSSAPSSSSSLTTPTFPQLVLLSPRLTLKVKSIYGTGSEADEPIVTLTDTTKWDPASIIMRIYPKIVRVDSGAYNQTNESTFRQMLNDMNVDIAYKGTDAEGNPIDTSTCSFVVVSGVPEIQWNAKGQNFPVVVKPVCDGENGNLATIFVNIKEPSQVQPGRGLVYFTQAGYGTVYEQNKDTITVTVKLEVHESGLDNPGVIQISPSGTASQNQDYRIIDSPFPKNIPVGSNSQEFQFKVAILNDNTEDALFETILITLSSTGSLDVGQSTYQIAIREDDNDRTRYVVELVQPANAILSFSSATPPLNASNQFFKNDPVFIDIGFMNTCWKYTSWQNPCDLGSSSTQCRMTVTNNISQSVNLGRIPTSVYQNPPINGTIAYTPVGTGAGNNEYFCGDTVQFSAIPSVNYNFLNWKDNLSGSINPKTVTLGPTPLTVGATFGISGCSNPGVTLGNAYREVFTNFTGNIDDIRNLTGPAIYNNIVSLDANDINQDNYGQRIRAWLVPPVTGDYTFHINSDDQSKLLIAESGDPRDAIMIAQMTTWNARDNYTKEAGQTSQPILLSACQKYYIEILHKEGNGGDFVQVAWTGAAGELNKTIIAGEFLAPYNDSPPTNAPPVVTTCPSAPVTIQVGQSVSLNANVSDADGDNITCLWSGSGWTGNSQIVIGNGTCSDIFTPATMGNYTLNLRAEDPYGALDNSCSKQINVNGGCGDNIVVFNGSTVPSISWQNANYQMTGLVTEWPADGKPGFVGPHWLFRATGSGAGTYSGEIPINGGPYNMTEDSLYFSVLINQEASAPITSFYVQLVDANGNVSAAKTIVNDWNITQHNLRASNLIIGAFDITRVSKIKFTAITHNTQWNKIHIDNIVLTNYCEAPISSSSEGTSSSSSGVSSSSSAVNNPPVITQCKVLNPVPIYDHTDVTLTVSAGDPDGDILDYSWGGDVSGTGQSIIRQFATPGVYSATVVVGDGKGAYDMCVVPFTIQATPKLPPTISCVATPTSGEVSDDVALNVNVAVTADDPDGNNLNLSLSWSGDGYTGTSLNTYSETQTSIFTTPGTYSIKVIATDEQGLSAECTKSIVVSGNDLPVIATCPALPAAIYTNSAANFSMSATDPDGDAMYYAWNFGDGGVDSVVNTAHTYTMAGSYNYTAYAWDDFHTTSRATCTGSIQVVDAPVIEGCTQPHVFWNGTASYGSWTQNQFLNQGIINYNTNGFTQPTYRGNFWSNGTTHKNIWTLPAVTNMGNANIRMYADIANIYSSFDMRLIDETGDSTQWYTMPKPSGRTLISVSVNNLVPNVGFDIGTVTKIELRLVNWNGSGDIYLDDFEMKCPNQPPTAVIVANPMSGNSPLSVSFDGSGSIDDNNNIVSYLWTFAPGVTSTNMNATRTFTTGSHSVSLTVTDGDGGIGTSTVMITVNASAPSANFTASPTVGDVPVLVNFNASASTDDGTIVSYAWNFGDGGTGSGVTASRNYTAAGTYIATLTLTDNDGLTSTATRTITVYSAVPTSLFTYAKSGNTVSFNGSGSSDPDGVIVSYAWNFGNGQSGTGVTPSHIYGAPGNYTVTLTVTDDAGRTGTSSQVINIDGPPTAVLAANPVSGTAPLTVNFSSAGSTDPGGSVVAYDWKFGDGTTSTAANPSKTYPWGVYTAELRVRDNTGNWSAWVSRVITVTSPAPVPAIAASPTAGEAPLTSVFTGSATDDGTIVAWAWNFGDGTTSSVQNPGSHLFPDIPGQTYTVTLTVTDDAGLQGTATRTITVYANDKPVIASCPATPTTAYVGANISFNGSNVTDAEDNPISLLWNFGDGNTASAASVTHAYASSGTKVYTLEAWDAYHTSDKATCSGTLTILDNIIYTPCTEHKWFWRQDNTGWTRTGGNQTDYDQNAWNGFSKFMKFQLWDVGRMTMTYTTPTAHNGYESTLKYKLAKADGSATQVGIVLESNNGTKSDTVYDSNLGNYTQKSILVSAFGAPVGFDPMNIKKVHFVANRTSGNTLIINIDELGFDCPNVVPPTITGICATATDLTGDINSQTLAPYTSRCFRVTKAGSAHMLQATNNFASGNPQLSFRYYGNTDFNQSTCSLQDRMVSNNQNFSNAGLQLTSDGTMAGGYPYIVVSNHHATVNGIYSLAFQNWTSGSAGCATITNLVPVAPGFPPSGGVCSISPTSSYAPGTTVGTLSTPWNNATTTEWSFNNGSTWQTSATSPALAAGSYVVQSRGTNANGSATATCGTFTVNTNTAPAGGACSVPSTWMVTGSSITPSQTTAWTDATNNGALTLEWSYDGGTTWTTSGTSPAMLAGTYAVRYRAKDALGATSTVASCGTVTIGANTAPAGGTCTVTPTTVNRNVNVTASLGTAFTDATPNGAAFRYRWSWNGGSTWSGYSTTSSATNSWPTASSNTVRMRVRDGAGGVGTVTCGTVTVNSPAPVPTITATPEAGEAQLTSSFSATATTSGSIASWSWDFGDGTYSSVQNPGNHTFPDIPDQAYTVTLTVTDDIGSVGTATKTITVYANDKPVIASCPVSPASVVLGTAVNFTSTVSDAEDNPIFYNWNLGDGNTSSAAAFSHTYASSGVKAYSLEAWDAYHTGDKATCSGSVEVTEATGCPETSKLNLEVREYQVDNALRLGMRITNYQGSAVNYGDLKVVAWYNNAGKTAANFQIEGTGNGYIDNPWVGNSTGLSLIKKVDVTPGANYNWMAEYRPATNTISNSGQFIRDIQMGLRLSDWSDPVKSNDYSNLAGNATYHNNPTFVLMQKVNNQWTVVKEYTNASTLDLNTGVRPDGLLCEPPPSAPPVAVASSNISTGDFPLAVNFTGNGSTDDVGIVSYSWNFGDGTSATGKDVSKTYTAPGTYNAVLTVMDGNDQSATATRVITVTGTPVTNCTCPSGCSTLNTAGGSLARIVGRCYYIRASTLLQGDFQVNVNGVNKANPNGYNQATAESFLGTKLDGGWYVHFNTTGGWGNINTTGGTPTP